MKNVLSIFLILILCVSCDKVPMNGDLDGMWQLMSIEEGGVVTNIKSEKRYMSFQLHLVQFGHGNKNDINGVLPRHCYAHFKHKGDSIFIYDLCHDSENATSADNNEWYREEDLQKIKPWGMYSLNNRFKVEKLDSDAMILRREDLVLKYRKF